MALAARLRDATRALHTAAEHSPLMRRLLAGRLPRADYIAILRDLHALYAALEWGLVRHSAHEQLAPLPLARLVRLPALARDLCKLHGPDWARELQPGTDARAYAEHLHLLADTAPHRLAAHAYVRYLGDLAGGQTLARVVARQYGLAAGEGVSFYDFGPPAAARELAAAFRAGLDRIATHETIARDIEEEAVDGFRRHVAMFASASPVHDGGREHTMGRVVDNDTARGRGTEQADASPG